LSKKIGEEIAKSFTRGYALETVALRICYVWFPHMAESYPSLTVDPGERKWINGLWLYNDARDVATAFRLASEVPDLRHEVFLLSAEDNGTIFETMELVRRYYGKVPMRKKLKGRESLADYSKATLILGYRPRYTWRDTIA
jgi:nucleoside-diphosphate-sugar epimerase